jgi:hypothetical protein
MGELDKQNVRWEQNYQKCFKQQCAGIDVDKSLVVGSDGDKEEIFVGAS